MTSPNRRRPTLETVRILVVEDQPYMRQIVRQTLERLGVHYVYEADDGGAALKMTVRLVPDLVFCDIHMEPVDGLKYLEGLRGFKKPDVATTPVVFLTSDAEEATVLKSKKLAINGYIVKPTSAGKLKENVNRLLGPIIP